MRVLHVTSSFPRHDDDVIAPWLGWLVAGQRAAGLDVHVLAPHDAGLARDDHVQGVPVHRFRYAPDRWERLAYRGGLLATARGAHRALVVPYFAAMTLASRGAVRDLAPDVVHAHWWIPGGLAAADAGGGRRTALVVTLHGSDVGLLRHRVARAAFERLRVRAQAVVAVSEPLRHEAGVDGVARMPMHPNASSDTALPAGPPWRLLFIGRLTPEKGVDIAVDAVASARRRGVDVELDVVGDGPQRGHCVGRERVRVHGSVTPQHLHALIDGAHAVVVPSRREGLGLVAVEALARRRPVIASRVGGLVEVVGEGDGILVAPDDAEALADAIGRLPLGAPVAPAAPARHAIERVVADHTRLYEQALSAWRARRDRSGGSRAR